MLSARAHSPKAVATAQELLLVMNSMHGKSLLKIVQSCFQELPDRLRSFVFVARSDLELRGPGDDASVIARQLYAWNLKRFRIRATRPGFASDYVESLPKPFSSTLFPGGMRHGPNYTRTLATPKSSQVFSAAPRCFIRSFDFLNRAPASLEAP